MLPDFILNNEVASSTKAFSHIVLKVDDAYVTISYIRIKNNCVDVISRVHSPSFKSNTYLQNCKTTVIFFI